MNIGNMGCFKDLEGTLPCKPGDPVALIRCENAPDLIQPLVAHRPIMTAGGPDFGVPEEDNETEMHTK